MPRIAGISLLTLPLLLGCGGDPDFGSGKRFDVDQPAAAPGNWPNWRGPKHDGVSTEVAWSSEWPDDGPTRRWSIDVGRGFSSVAVAEGRVYTMGHLDDREIVYCLDAEGRKIWQHAYQADPVDYLHRGGPSATPAVVDGRVYTLGKQGHLFCFDASSGEVAWSLFLPDELDVDQPAWGFTCSPLVHRDLIIVDAGRAAAFDRQSGTLAWKTAEYSAGYGSPVAFRHEGEPRIAVLNNQYLLVLDAATGSEQARYAWETFTDTGAVTPLVHNGTVFISSAYNTGQCELLRFDGASFERVYKNDDMKNHMATCVLWDGHLYGIHGNSRSRHAQLVCMEHATGQVAWSQRGLGCGALTVAGGKLIIQGEKGELVIAEASPDKYRELARTTAFDDESWTVPVLTGGRIYCRSMSGRLVCFDVAKKITLGQPK